MGRSKQRVFLTLLAGGFLFLLLDMLLLEYWFFQVKRFSIGKRYHNADKHIKILHLTDLHFTRLFSWKYRRLANRINKIRPDIILISGDSIDQDGRSEPLEKFLRLLKYDIPKVAVLGNHEYESRVSIERLKKLYRLVNGDLLINESKAYHLNGVKLMVTGLDDLLHGKPDFNEAVKNVRHEDHHLVLIHSPKQQEKVREQIAEINHNRSKSDQLNIYALFAGHNHGGQVKFGSFVPHLPPMAGDYVEGWYNEEKPYLYLSRGFGSSKVPVRLGARSEITVFEYFG